ncbi:hypothetical protein GOB93_11470 [Acetobacter musti]|uniref:HNH endonuclease n=1 Tax=Acetobacter musti TaxID=864732 RepID=A0ABX0JPB2_9PROT|nr:hypothetical protein [Acetobacter musti]NHN85256.1 hypothetical protein [Acetobacter musti]
MGDAKRRQMSRKAFLTFPENQLCCYCGGLANEIDHFPPRNFFNKRQAPEGYIYPACSTCNRGKSLDEQALSLLVSMLDWGIDDEDSRFRTHLHEVRNNRPEVIRELTALSSVQSKFHLRQMFGTREAVSNNGMNGWQAAELGPHSTDLLNKMCVWFGQTLYFKHNKEIFRGEVFATHLPWSAIRHEKFQEIISKLSGIPNITHTSHDISAQFFYRYFAVKGGFYAILQFRKPQIFFVICAMTEQYIPSSPEINAGWFRSGLIGPPMMSD